MSVDLVTLAMSTAVSAAVQGLVGLLIYVAIRRNLEKVDRLEETVKELEDQKIARINADIREHKAEDDKRFEAAAKSRLGLHEDVEDIRTHFVHVKTCQKQHETFTAAVTDLARVQERTETTTRMLDNLNQRITGIIQDLAKVEAVQDERGRKQR